MNHADKAQIERLLRRVETTRPGWRASYIEDGAVDILVSIENATGRRLCASLPLSVERTRSDFWGSVNAIVRAVDRKVKTQASARGLER